MTPVSDLTFEELITQFSGEGDPFFVGEDTTGNIGILVSLTALAGEPIENLTDVGVVKMVSRLLDLCRKAQVVANQGKPEGEKLNAFPAPTSSATIQDGYLEVTEYLKSRIIISSATQIQGSTI